LSAFVDGDFHLAAIVGLQARAALPVIVLGEFRYGIAGSRHRKAYEAWLQENVPLFEVLDITGRTASVYAELRAQLKQAGRPIPANDLWIAALALEHRMPVLTRDAHFEAIPKLRSIAW
jgi:tRNA(fMet)-specific endonuclease VapC